MKNKKTEDYGTIDIEEDNVFINKRNSNYQSFQIPSPLLDSQPTVLDETEPIQEIKPKSFFLSLLLDNTGSTARDHLANERTFLAWLRTSLALATLGIAISQLDKLKITPPPPEDGTKRPPSNNLFLGTLYISGGLIFVLFGLFRYYYIQTHLMDGKFPASRYTIMVGVVFLFIIILTLIYIITSDVTH